MSEIILPEIRTPYYIINEEKLRDNFYSLKQAFEKDWKNLIIGYSFKTNSLPWILNWIKDNGGFAEVVSKEEYELALKIGFLDCNIIFNGPVKDKEILKRALLNGAIVNLDSFEEIDWIINNVSQNDNINVGLRINFDLERYCPNETIVGNEPGRFGFNLENGSLYKAVEILKKYKNINIKGIHLHNSTRTKSLNIFNKLVEIACEVNRNVECIIEYVDIGGCFFGDKPGAPSFEEYAAVVKNLKKTFGEEIVLILEPGAALIASPVDFVCTAIDVKEVKNKRIITTDGSCHNINPSMSGVKFVFEVQSIKNNICNKQQIICGYTCIEKDRMAVCENVKEIEVGDKIIFHNTGAYSMALQPLFIQYYPAVIVKEKEDYYYARMPWGIEEYMSKNFIGYEKHI